MARDVRSCSPFAQLFLRLLPRSRRKLCADPGWSTRNARDAHERECNGGRRQMHGSTRSTGSLGSRAASSLASCKVIHWYKAGLRFPLRFASVGQRTEPGVSPRTCGKSPARSSPEGMPNPNKAH